VRDVPGSCTAAQLDRTVTAIARVQLADGCIPWFDAGHADPWNMTEAAMALDVGGLGRAAEAAYRWLAGRQMNDGSWAHAYRAGYADTSVRDANFCTYFSAGVWHHFLCTRDRVFLEQMWPHVDRSTRFALGLQTPGGAIAWARDAQYQPTSKGLLTSSSCIYLSLRCALAIIRELGGNKLDWELAITDLATAVASKPEEFIPKDRFSMDWYYPILGGVLRGTAATDRLADRWEDLVVDGRGLRCVSDRAWVTSGETAEFVLALCALGLDDTALEFFGWMQSLRAGSDLYWTGATHPGDVAWPSEQTTWSAGSVILAADALTGISEGRTLFSGESLPALPPLDPIPDPF
jgi:hypothetical protein